MMLLLRLTQRLTDIINVILYINHAISIHGHTHHIRMTHPRWIEPQQYLMTYTLGISMMILLDMFYYFITVFKPFLPTMYTMGNIICTHRSSYMLMGVSSNIISSSLNAADSDVVNFPPYSWSKSILGFFFSFSMKFLSNSLPMLTV